MKNLLSIIAIVITGSLFGQPGKSALDSVTERGNELLNWSKGVSIVRGAQNLRFYPLQGSYFSAGAGTYAQPGRWNVVIGENAGDSITTGARNTFFGKNAGQKTRVGNDNLAVGWDALRDNIFGNSNLALIQDAMRSNLRGSNNVALGRGSQFSNIAGNHNISAGWQSLYFLTDGHENVAIGGYAGAFLLKGSGNVYIGQYAGEHNDAAVGKTIDNSIYIGRYSGLQSAHSNSITIGYNTQSTGDYKINIGNTIYGDILSGDVSAKSITISGRQITFDDNYMYVRTSTGITKRISLEELSSSTKAVTVNSNQTVPIYSIDGKQIGYATFKF